MKDGRTRKLFHIGAGILILVIVIQPMIFFSSEPPLVISGLEWSIESADLFVYEIHVSGARDSLNEEVPYLWGHLNNTRISVNVTHLPVLLPFYTSTDFIENIVESPKVTCTFDNGTSLSDSDQFVGSLVSMALLPTGSWKYFDLLFPDKWSGKWEMYEPDYTWVAGYDDGELFFGHLGESWHDSKGWSARINMTSGVPFRMETHDNYHDYGFNVDVLEMILVDHMTS